jgi:muconolactone D-isomerase
MIDVNSHDDLDRMLMALMPLSANLIVEELSPVLEYTSFAEDLRRKWS